MQLFDKKELLQGYKNLEVIIDFYLNIRNIKFETSDLAPDTFNGMVNYFNYCGHYLVYDGGDHGFLGADYNIKFRAVHDHMHRVYNLNFNFENEIKLSAITEDLFGEIALSLGFTFKQVYVIMSIIDAEIKGQIEYYKKYSNYVDDQKQFILDYLGVAA